MRKTFSKLTNVLSLILLVAPAALWVRNCWVDDYLIREDERYDLYFLRSTSGALSAGWDSPFCKAYAHGPVGQWVHNGQPVAERGSLARLVPFADFAVTFNDSHRSITLPHWY